MQRADLAEIFSTCDIISLHTAYNEYTRHMVNAELLSKIKEGALFVNTARGGLVDEEALVRELRTGRFRAVLDVFETEPLPAESGLLNLENVLLMPHMCGPTVDRRAHIAAALLEEARAYLEDGAGLPDEITLERALCMSDK